MQPSILVLVAAGVVGGGALGFYLGYSSHGLMVAILGMVIGGAGALLWLGPSTGDATGRPKP
jgi:hypothetical protein